MLKLIFPFYIFKFFGFSLFSVCSRLGHERRPEDGRRSRSNVIGMQGGGVSTAGTLECLHESRVEENSLLCEIAVKALLLVLADLMKKLLLESFRIDNSSYRMYLETITQLLRCGYSRGPLRSSTYPLLELIPRLEHVLGDVHDEMEA